MGGEGGEILVRVAAAPPALVGPWGMPPQFDYSRSGIYETKFKIILYIITIEI